jgi:hypothetical protein
MELSLDVKPPGTSLEAPSSLWGSPQERSAPLDSLTLHIVGPLAPDSQRAALLSVKGVEWSTGGPQMQHRTRDAPRCFLIRFVVLDI